VIDDDPKADAAHLKAERAFKQKEDGAKAMTEYEAEGRAVRAKTARLKVLRLEKEAKEKSAAVAKKKPESVPSKTGKRRGRPPGTKNIAKAADLAGAQIDRLADRSATDEQRANRKRRLLKGPKEFRDIRGRPKPKR
jgi:hypothetical protein